MRQGLALGVGLGHWSWGWPFLLLGCFSGVGVGILSRGEGWPFSGLKFRLALPSWSRGWPTSCGYNHNLNNNHTMIIISNGGGKQDRDWPLGLGSAVGVGSSLWASPSLSWEEVGPFRSGRWPFGLGSALWGEGWPFFLGVGVGPSVGVE